MKKLDWRLSLISSKLGNDYQNFAFGVFWLSKFTCFCFIGDWLTFLRIPVAVLFFNNLSSHFFIMSIVTYFSPGPRVNVSPGIHLTFVKGSPTRIGGGKFLVELLSNLLVVALLIGLGVSGMNLDTCQVSIFLLRSTIDSLFARILYRVTLICLSAFSFAPHSKFLNGFSSSFIIPRLFSFTFIFELFVWACSFLIDYIVFSAMCSRFSISS